MTRHCHYSPITTVERRDMQSMRNYGTPVPDIAIAFDCSTSTVYHHTTARVPRSQIAARNERMLKDAAGASLERREFIARRNGLASAGSLSATLSAFRRKQREQSGARA